MNWKNWPYWVKGGVLFSLLSLILGVYFVVYDGLRSDILTAIYSPGLTVLYLAKGGLFSGNQPSILETFFVMTLNGFVYGVIVGWFYGKFKNRNKLPPSSNL